MFWGVPLGPEPIFEGRPTRFGVGGREIMGGGSRKRPSNSGVWAMSHRLPKYPTSSALQERLANGGNAEMDQVKDKLLHFTSPDQPSKRFNLFRKRPDCGVRDLHWFHLRPADDPSDAHATTAGPRW